MAFHPYPGVIPAVFNRRGFGPPRGLTPASACPRVAHPASRLRDATQQDAILKTRFRCGSLPSLTSPRPATRWLILQKARRHTAKVLRLLVGARFQALFHSPPGVLFTFPSRYSFAIGRRRVFSLGGWSPLIRAGFLVPGPTRGRVTRRGRASRTGPSPSAAGLPMPFRCTSLRRAPGGASPGIPRPATPGRQRMHAVAPSRVWASRAFARRYWRDLG